MAWFLARAVFAFFWGVWDQLFSGSAVSWSCIPGGGGGNSAREFSAGKIPYFNSVRNLPLIFRGEVRNFPHAEFCLCKPP